MQRMVDFGHVAVEAAHDVLLLGIALELFFFVDFELPLARLALAHEREVVEAEHNVLRRHDDRRAVRGMQDVVGGHHQHARFKLRFQRQRNVHGHLVAIEVGVERGADQRMQLDRLALDQHRLEGLDTEAGQRWGAVQEPRMLADPLVEDVPTLRLLLLDQLLGLLDRGRQALGVEPRVDERLEQFERHLLRQTALMQFQFGADHDHRAAGIVDALAEQVLPETALLALDHVGERLQRPLVGARDDTAATTVVEQRIDRFLEHAFFVADDDVRRSQLNQPLQTVVAVYDTAIEVVEVGRSETPAVKRHQRPQIGWNHWHDREDHPLRLIARGDEGLNQLPPFGDLLLFDIAVGLRDFVAQLSLHLPQVDRFEHFADGFRANQGSEAVGAVLLLRLQVLFLGQQLPILERGEARLKYDVVFEVQDALEVLERHVEQQTNAAR